MCSQRLFLYIVAAIFLVVALLHLMRLINGWPVIVGDWLVPLSVSWGGVVVPASLSVWALMIARSKS